MDGGHRPEDLDQLLIVLVILPTKRLIMNHNCCLRGLGRSRNVGILLAVKSFETLSPDLHSQCRHFKH